MCKSSQLLVVLLFGLSVSPAVTAEESWFESPSLNIMTGFIYEPKSLYTIHEWKETLGEKFDADRWVKGFKEVGAQHLVFYDKWIDGLVFHDTKTTNFKTKRDFVRELAAACQRGGLRLVFYFNAVSDGNPEFDQWSLLDQQGKPIVFSSGWPTRYQTLHSPFRRKVVEQVRELLSNYGPVDGIWHDIFGERIHTSSKWAAQGYEKMYGEKFDKDKVTSARFSEFKIRTLADYLDEVDAIRREQHQETCVFTANGSGSRFLPAGIWTRWVGSRLHYLFNEGHSFAHNDQLARMAWVLPKPLDINFLINSSWFTPLEDAPPPPGWTRKQVIAATAIVVCQGASVNFALTPGHSGVFGEDLQLAKAAGAWFRQVRPWLENAQPYADVAIVMGTPSADGPGLPTGNSFWRRYKAKSQGAWTQAVALGDALSRVGIFSQFLYDMEQGGNWPESLARFQAILVPELAVLDEARTEQLRQYVKKGGRLVAFGHASLLDAEGRRRKDYALGDVLGLQYQREIAFPRQLLKTQVKVDSEYSSDFVAENLVDGLPTAWASSGTSMPHWAEIILAEPVDVAKVELVNRQGPYRITDVDIEAYDGNTWKIVKSVRDATSPIISTTLDEPVRTSRIRVRILRELYQNEKRNYADLEEIRVVDKAGRNWARARGTTIQVIPVTSELQRAFADVTVSFPPMAVRVKLVTAELVAKLGDKEQNAAILRNRFGQGNAFLVTTGEGAFPGGSSFWTGLMRLVVGEPTLSFKQEDARRYRFILTQVAGAHVLHVIDPVAEGSKFQAAEVEISVQTERFDGLNEARLVGAAGALPARKKGNLMTFIVRPDPVASVVLQ